MGRLTRPLVLFGMTLLLALWNGQIAARRRFALGGTAHELRVCFSPEAPFAFRRGEEFTGTEIELLRSLAGSGVILEPVAVPFADLIPALRARKCQIIATGMFILPSRCRLVAFSEPTIAVERGFLRNGPAKERGIDSYEKVAAAQDVMLAVVEGGVSYQAAISAKVPSGRLLAVQTLEEAVRAFEEGNADVIGGSVPALERYRPAIGGVPDVVSLHAGGRDAKSYGAFAFHPEDTQLRDQVNGYLLGGPMHTSRVDLLKRFGLEKGLPRYGITTKKLCDDLSQEDVTG